MVPLILAALLYSAPRLATAAEGDPQQPETIDNVIDGVRFEAGNWPPDLAAGEADVGSELVHHLR